ncbi:MAG: sugar transferase [Rubritepida sp.]|nr:sugar transferase [Rubritepida sp.]
MTSFLVPPSRRAAPAPGSLSALAAWPWIAGTLDLAALTAAGIAWCTTSANDGGFAPLEAVLLAGLLAIAALVALWRLAPPEPARRADPAGTVTEALLVPAALGGAGALGASLLLGAAAAEALMLWAILAALALAPARLVLALAARRGLRAGGLRRRIAIIGASDQAERLVLRLRAAPALERPAILGIYDDRTRDRRPESVAGVPVRGPVAALAALAARERVDSIVIALPLRRAITILRSLQQVQWLAAEVLVLLGEEEMPPPGAAAAPLAGEPALRLVRPPAPGAGALAKAVLDRAGAALGLAVLAPLLALAALALRLEGPGPVLRRDERLGRFGRPFRLLRFRTAREGAGAAPSPVGRVLRAAWIDELPQLVNVLRGEMSLVGPRPHAPGLAVGGVPMARLAPGYAARLRMKPGVTGWALVHGLRGPILNRGMAREVVAHDLAYITEWSVWLDLRILARTALIVVLGRGGAAARPRAWGEL